MSFAQIAQVFQATLSVLHSYHRLYGVYMDIGHDWERALAATFQSTATGVQSPRDVY